MKPQMWTLAGTRGRDRRARRAAGIASGAESAGPAARRRGREGARRGDAADAAASGGSQVRGPRRPAHEAGRHGGRRDLAEGSRQRQPVLGAQRRDGRSRGHAGLGRGVLPQARPPEHPSHAVRSAAGLDAEVVGHQLHGRRPAPSSCHRHAPRPARHRRRLAASSSMSSGSAAAPTPISSAATSRARRC